MPTTRRREVAERAGDVKSISNIKQQTVSLNSGFALLVSTLPEKSYMPEVPTDRDLGRNRCPR